jgi:cell division septal protein FtsQ
MLAAPEVAAPWQAHSRVSCSLPAAAFAGWREMKMATGPLLSLHVMTVLLVLVLLVFVLMMTVKELGVMSMEVVIINVIVVMMVMVW